MGTGPHVVVKVVSSNNFVVRRTGTRYTQTLNKIRLKLYAPNQRVPDVTVRREDYLHYSAQASFSLIFVESGTRKLRKVVESRTKFLFDVKRFLDSTTVLVLDSTPTLLL